MAYVYPFPSQMPSASHDLPATLISLEDWALISVDGADARTYLQGQLTCDVNALQSGHCTQAAHCDAKGKLWSNILLFASDDRLAYLERRSVAEQQLSELKKYAVFSKVTMQSADDRVLLGFAGIGARGRLAETYHRLPDADTPVVESNGAVLLRLASPSERFIIIASGEEAKRLFDAQLGKVALNNALQWLALDIEAGAAIIDAPNGGQFLPQSLNLQALNAISFSKGCYSGQEMVARAKYRGANKRALYWLAGKSFRQPAAGEELELQIGDGWRRTGCVLAAVKLADDTLWVQAVLNNDLTPDAALRLREDEGSRLAIRPLPYSLSEA